MMPKRDKILTMFKIVKALSELSTCRRAKVAAIIVPEDFSRIDAIGYNGQPSGMPNGGCTGVEGKCGCVHAEANALLKLRSWESGLILVTAVYPCPDCAGLIVNSKRVKRVIYLYDYRIRHDILDRAGIDCWRWDD